MNFETPQFESFWKRKSKEELAKESAETAAKEGVRMRTVLLASDARAAFTSNDLSTALEKLQELARVAKPERASGGLEFGEAKELFGKDFIGPEAVLKTFGVRLPPNELKNIEKIPFDRETLEKAKNLGMMLVLRVPHDQKGDPLTIKRMQRILGDVDYLGRENDKKTRMFDSASPGNWYEDEGFAREMVAQLGWGLACKSILEESRDIDWHDQEKVLHEWAKGNDLDPASVRRRTPVEVAYDTLAYYGANQESLLEHSYDWTRIRAEDDDFVRVGDFGRSGLAFESSSWDDPDAAFGICPTL
jgi:hypothetical protein